MHWRPSRRVEWLLLACLLLPGAARPSKQMLSPPPKPPTAAAPLTEALTYPVDGLIIKGFVCRPDKKLGRPLLNLVHGGLDTPVDLTLCRRLARLGYVVAASALRGQGGSQGKVEICGGEVSDVRALRSLVEGRYKTDRGRVGYLGISLGGCVAIKAASSTTGVRAVVTLLSPTDFAEQLKLLSYRPDVAQRWEALLGGSAEQVGHAYEARRPLEALKQLRAPLLTVAADRDQLIPLRQSCSVLDIRRQMGLKVSVVRQTKDGGPADLTAQVRQLCTAEAAVSQLPALKGQDVLLIYENLDHLSTPAMWKAAEAYLAANLD
ncbi:hypothetical protein EHF33_00690 [Deinococcus psychrotolerans]|uniref:Xaa-Pro dipeptidyl-peptidase-like domain-containing protein n=1 Tax=Deinococcus psychrotolerans TaxID=2489213 RepID=A0A3G8Y7U6_9DEIO|nr:hypothetical protein EHF33_00690 [Deinococcus psychrotolerans]